MNTEKLNRLAALIEEKTAFVAKVNEDQSRYSATIAAIHAVCKGNDDVVNTFWLPLSTTNDFRERINIASKYEQEIPEHQKEMDCIVKGIYYVHKEPFVYFWGKKTEMITICSEAEEIVFRILCKVMEATYHSKANAFRILFGITSNSTEYNCHSLSDTIRDFAYNRKEEFIANAEAWCKNRTEYADVLEMLKSL